MTETIIPDTKSTIEIGESMFKKIGLLGAALTLTAISAAIAFDWLPATDWSAFFRERMAVAGYMGLVLFGLGSIFAVRGLFSAPDAIVTFSPLGIRDTRISSEFVPWTTVRSVKTWEFRQTQVMVLAIDPDVESHLPLTRGARMTRRANKALGADGLCVAATCLTINYATLLHTTLAYLDAARSPARTARRQVRSA